MTALRLLPLAFRTRSTARYNGPGMLTATLVASLPISSPPDGWYAESITRVIPTGKAHTGADEPSGQHGARGEEISHRREPPARCGAVPEGPGEGADPLRRHPSARRRPGRGPPADRSPPALGEGRQDGPGLQGPADAARRPRPARP